TKTGGGTVKRPSVSLLWPCSPALPGWTKTLGCAVELEPLLPLVAVTVSQYLSLPMARKAMPPEVITLSVALTVLSSVLPSLSYHRPVILPPVPQTTSMRYQWLEE